MTVSNPIDYEEAALIAGVAHADLVKALMDLVDLFDYVQGVEPDKSALRKSTGKIIRESTITHSLALGALTVDFAPETSKELIERADSFDSEGGA